MKTGFSKIHKNVVELFVLNTSYWIFPVDQFYWCTSYGIQVILKTELGYSKNFNFSQFAWIQDYSQQTDVLQNYLMY